MVEDYGIQTTMCKINKLQGYIIQHKEYSQSFITTNGVKIYTNFESLSCIPETNMTL